MIILYENNIFIELIKILIIKALINHKSDMNNNIYKY